MEVQAQSEKRGDSNVACNICAKARASSGSYVPATAYCIPGQKGRDGVVRGSA